MSIAKPPAIVVTAAQAAAAAATAMSVRPSQARDTIRV
jgi:hypothetical protein